MIYGREIETSPAPFQPGDRVRFWCKDDPPGIHTVEAASEAHTKLEGFNFAVFTWQLKRVRKTKG